MGIYPYCDDYSRYNGCRFCIKMGIKLTFRAFLRGMSSFGELINLCVITILLLIVYVTAVGPTALAAGIFKKRFLDRKPGDENSYWTNLNLSKKNTEEYYRQF